jgi:hypothetical protein
MVRRNPSIPLPEPASLANSPPASLREALRAGLKICERCRLVGVKISTNGDCVGTTPLLVEFAIDKFGRAIRDIELRAVAPESLATEEIG